MLTLSGCSYSYDVQANLSGGHLTFDANPQWGADCVREVEVSWDGGAASAQTEVVWDQEISYADGCKNKFPIVYGARLKGQLYGYDSEGAIDPTIGSPASLVAAKMLQVGVIYTVHTVTGATGYGCGRFRLQADNVVQNLGCT